MSEIEDRVERVADDLVAELATAHRAEEAAREAMEQARRRHREVTAALARLAALMDREARQRLHRRMGQLSRRTVERRRPLTGRQEAVMAFLVEEVRDSFRTWQLAAYLEDLDFRLPPKAAANICRDLARRGMLTRLGQGHYALDRTHPVLFEKSMAWAREGLE